MSEPAPRPRAEPEAQEVASFLAARPDFLLDYPDLAAQMRLPAVDRGAGVIDLQVFQVERLRAEIRRMKDLQRDLIATARANAQIQARVNQAALSLVAADSFERLVQSVTTDLAVILDVDVCALCIEDTHGQAKGGRLVGVQLLEAGLVNAYLGADKRALLRENTQGDPEIFGAGAGLVRSDAMVRLDFGPAGPKGLVAFGSRRSGAFHAGQGTELLCFLACVLELSVRRWLDLPPD